MLNSGITNWMSIRSAFFKTLNKYTSNYYLGITTKIIGSLSGTVNYITYGLLKGTLKLNSEKLGYYEFTIDKNLFDKVNKDREYTITTGGNLSTLLGLPFPLASRISVDIGKELLNSRLNTYTATNNLGLRLSLNHTLLFSQIHNLGESYAQTISLNGGFNLRTVKGFWEFITCVY